MKKTNDPIIKEIDQIKRLLMLQLVMNGASPDIIGLALGVSGRWIRKEYSIGDIRVKIREATSE